MEAVVERSNMLCAYERVVKNQGAPGVDGLTVAGLKPWLQAHWSKVRQALLAGEYMPAAVRTVDIPKPQGGVRTLGIPTVLDRLIQQALNQVLQPLFDPEFSPSTRGELVTGRSISSPQECVSAHPGQSHPFSSHEHSAQTSVAGAAPQELQRIAGGSLRASSWAAPLGVPPARTPATFNFSSVVEP